MEPMYTVEAFRQQQGWELRIEGGHWVTHAASLTEAIPPVRRHLCQEGVPNALTTSIVVAPQN